MKKRSFTMAALLIGALFVTALPGRPAAAAPTQSRALSVLLYIDGSLGDLGFFDSANSGVTRAQRELGVATKVVQQSDSTQWQSQILSLAGTHKYDLIIFDASDPTMGQAAAALIKRYPQQRVIDFDDNQFTTKPQSANSVSSIIYRQNEGSFLAGALAAMVVDARLRYTSGKKTVGMVGGQDIPVIRDFKDGYVTGVKAVDPSIKVQVTYIGGDGSNSTWNNKPAGARLARSLYDVGSSVVYQVAGGSGLGVLDQARLSGRYAIGVDSNQDTIAPGHVIGSVVKRVDNSLYDLIAFAQHGTLRSGYTYYFGLNNHGVDLTRDSETRGIITTAMYSRLDALARGVGSGKIHVPSEFK